MEIDKTLVGVLFFVTPNTHNVVHICTVCIVPSEVGTLSAVALSNSSVHITWTQPLQPNGIVTGQLHYILLLGGMVEVIELSATT